MLVGLIILSLVGIVFLSVGLLIWKKEKISLLHDYHYTNVSNKNKKDFCKLSGMGVATIGVGILTTVIVLWVTESVFSFIAFAIGFAIGLILLIYSGNKYNSK